MGKEKKLYSVRNALKSFVAADDEFESFLLLYYKKKCYNNFPGKEYYFLGIMMTANFCLILVKER